MQMMETLASRADQRAAWAFASAGVLVLVFTFSLCIQQGVKKGMCLRVKSPPLTMTLNGYMRAALVATIL